MKNATPHILIVDDNPLVIKSLSYLIKRLGFKYTSAADGEEAIQFARENIFDMIISDLLMPRMNGNELVRRVRIMPEYRYTPFLFLSGNTEEDTWIENLEDGADDFITKPFKAKVLESKIKANLKKAFLRKKILQTEKAKDFISQDSAEIVICRKEKDKLPLSEDKINGKVFFVENADALFNELYKNDVWLILVDSNAKWVRDILEKLMTLIETGTSVQVLFDENENEQNISFWMKNNVHGFLSKSKSKRFNNYCINSEIRQISELKNKYLEGLSLAASNSPIKFDSDLNLEVQDFRVSLTHQAFGNIPGGDFYEVFHIQTNKKLIILGDVMGKKWGAWFFVLAYIGYLRTAVNFFTDHSEYSFIDNPEKLIEILNKYVYRDLQLAEVFTTLTVLVIDAESKLLRVSSAGAIRPFLYKQNSNTVKQLNIVGTLLGVLEDASYKSVDINFEKDDKLLLFTDGYSESYNSKTGEMIGENALLNSFQEMAKQKDLKTSVIEEELIIQHSIKKFDDDRTMLLVRHI